MALPITATTAALCALLLLITAVDTVRQRMQSKTAFGDGNGNAKLISASRSHGNLAEHAPLAIIMIGLLEPTADARALGAVAAVFVIARICHIFGLYAPMSTEPPLGRKIGVVGTWLTYVVLIAWTLYAVARLGS
ncbi:MAG: MAPEG family protein [Sphingomonadales bacterium]|nr:MAPEG family protein [Sphingomonadales bacterium]MBK9999735.1 MAPEG family protein [Sphingomonadales bacterium]